MDVFHSLSCNSFLWGVLYHARWFLLKDYWVACYIFRSDNAPIVWIHFLCFFIIFVHCVERNRMGKSENHCDNGNCLVYGGSLRNVLVSVLAFAESLSVATNGVGISDNIQRFLNCIYSFLHKAWEGKKRIKLIFKLYFFKLIFEINFLYKIV